MGRSTQSVRPSFHFPPYGHINVTFADGRDDPPPAFLSTQLDDKRRARAWQEFILTLSHRIADWLWPVWNPSTSAWEGKAARTMFEVTRADLDLMKKARVIFKRSATIARLDHGSPASKTLIGIPHSEFFAAEDGGYLATRYDMYDPLLATYRKGISDDYERAILQFGGNTEVAMKQRIQRPRAYQVAFLLDPDQPLSFEHASRADTPSMISGHCFSGCMGGAGIADLLMSLEYAITEPSLRALQQYAVDIGDRRVFAGVHYPTDNVSSWFVALSLLKVLALPNSDRMGDFLATAIRRHSAIYALLKQNANRYPVGLLKPLDDLIDASIT